MKGLRRWALAAVLAAGFAVPALAASPASAEEVVQHEYLGEHFNGEDSSGGEFGNRLKEVNVNDETNNVFVTTDGCSACGVSQFTPAGKAQSYAYPLLGGASTLPYPFNTAGGETVGFTTVDNTGGPTQGRIYVVAGEKVYAFNPNGSAVPGFPITSSNARGVAVNPKTHNFWVSYSGSGVREYEPSGKWTGVEYAFPGNSFIQNNMAINSQGDMYVVMWVEGGKHVRVYNEGGELLYILDPASDGNDASVAISQTTDNVYIVATIEGTRKVWEYNAAGTQIASFGSPTPGLEGGQAVAVDSNTETVYVGSVEQSKQVDIFPTGGTLDIPGVTRGGVTEIAGTTATIHANVNPEGNSTTSCKFEWGPNANYGHTQTCSQGDVLTGNEVRDVSAGISGLSKGSTYHYRVIVSNAEGTATGADDSFVASAKAAISDEYVSDVHSDQAQVHAKINPEGVPTTFHVEYGTEPCETSACQSTEELSVGTGTLPIEVAFTITGLADGTRYHYRVVGTNQSGSGAGAEEFFITFPTTEGVVDPCENAHVRQQTGAALLLDCRAYELVSAGNTGGYNVESDLVEGQSPYDGYPEADSLLYAIHSGAIPGAGPAANRGRDPYIATRGDEGWTTKYVGIPSENPYSNEAFGSDLLEADPALGTFAFGGPGICSPCFEDGSTNIPLRLPSGQLVEGIGAAANPAGHVGRYLSADGEHLVFGSTTSLAAGGNENGDVSIYERELPNGPTQLVSTDTAGKALTGEGIAELSVSADGSRVVVGKKLSEDAAGNEYRHLYMHIDGRAASVDLMPGATDGALFDGMTEDGTKVFFTTDDSLVGEDTDTEADIYEAEVDSAGTPHLTLISKGGGAATCEPPEEWNTESGEENCDAMALAGGAGLASNSGTFYFLSPEQLDGSEGVLSQPNLYVVQPGGSAEFVATIDSSIGRPEPPPPNRPRITKGFGEVLGASAIGTAADGDVYVINEETGKIQRFKASGIPDGFPAAGGSNELQPPINFYYSSIAVDNSTGGPFSGDFYMSGGYEGRVAIFEPSGKLIGELNGIGEAYGIAVDPTDGAVYVSEYGGTILRFEPISSSPTVSNANYAITGIQVPEFFTEGGLAVDGQGGIYVGSYGGVRKFLASEFTAGPYPVVPGALFSKAGPAVAADPVTNEIAIAERGEAQRVGIYTPSGELIGHYGSGFQSINAVGLSPANHHLYASFYKEGFRITELGYEPIVFHLLANTAVRHAKFQPEVHTYGDFQVNPDGKYAAFASAQPLTGFDSNEHAEVFRYEPGASAEIICASCNPTNARATGESTLPTNGLGLLEDGRVFFDSTESIAPRDLDGKEDAYEWENGEVQLISTGVSAFASSLLGVDASGRDAYFFTRDNLVPQDQNGSLVKVYDAREKGGFPYTPPPVPCKASDECHGASSEAPGPPAIGTIRGTSGQYLEPGKAKKGCAKGKARRDGKCVKKKANHKKKHKKKHAKKRSR